MLKLLSHALPLGMLIIGWFSRASQDGRITLPELIEIFEVIVAELDLQLAIEIPPELAGTLAPARPGPPVGEA